MKLLWRKQESVFLTHASRASIAASQAEQDWQAEEPGPLNWEAGQGEHTEAPAREKVPARQGEQG